MELNRNPLAHLLVVVIVFTFTTITIGQSIPLDLVNLKHELQETIRDIQNYGEPPDFEKSLSQTLLQLQYKQYPHPHVLGPLEWYSANQTALQKLDICMVVSSLEGLYINSGIGTAYYSLAHLLARHSYNVTIIYTRDEPLRSGSFSSWVDYFQSHNITLRVLPPSHKRIASPKLQSRSYRLYQFLKHQNFDVVHFADFEGLGYYSTLAKRSGLSFQNSTLVVGLHGPTRWVADSNSKRALLQESELEVDWMERVSVEYADVVWTPSTYLASWLSNQSWVFPKKLYLLPLPPGPEALDVTPALPNKKMRVKELVFFGRLEARKGLVLFCDALDLLAKMQTTIPDDLSITFLGTLGHVDASDAGVYIQKRSSSWPFRFQIITDYNRTQALTYLHETGRLAVIPSLVDNAPYTVYECLFSGIPFVATATPSILPLIAQSYHAEHLFDPKPYDMVRKLVSILRSGAGFPAPVFTASDAEKSWLSFYGELSTSLVPNAQLESFPLVSVCITHFNRPALLKQALASIESQSYSNIEVILVDDGSNSTAASRYLTSIEPYFVSKGWRIIRTRNNYLGAARNLAVSNATGKYVLFLDDDNVAYPHQIATYVEVAERTQAHVFTSAHAIFRGVLPPDEHKVERYSVPLGPSLAVGIFKNCFGDANFFILREAFIASGGFTEDFGVGLEDHEFFASAVFNDYKLVVIPEALLYYRIHDISSQMVFTTDPRLGEARRLRPYIQALAGSQDGSISRSRRSIMEVVARNALSPRQDCNQTLTSISPSSGPISGGTTVTIRGSGFSCGVSSVRIGGQDCSGVRVISNSELTCLTPAGQVAYSSLDVVAEVSGIAVVLYASWMYTPLAAPVMTWCKLQDTGATVLCYFDSATDQANATNCALFTSGTIGKLGTGPVCYWVNPTTAAIDLGSEATITFNDKIELEGGVVRGQGSGGQPNQPVSVFLQKPDNPVRPVASISTPSNIGPCEGISLDASGSTGGAGRTLNLSWALVSVTPEPSQQVRDVLVQALEAATAQQLTKVEFTNSSISVHTTYVFSLKVSSWLEQSDTTTVSITKQDAAVPQVTISGPSLVQIYRNSPLSLQGVVVGSTCGGSYTDTVLYRWSVSPSVQLDQSSLNSATLQVPANTLTAGTSFEFTLLVTDAEQPDIQNSASVVVVVGLRDVIAKITGGNRLYAADEVVVLDGSESSDPDNIAPLLFQWSCSAFYDTSVPCDIANLEGTPQISIDAAALGHGKWQISLRVTSHSNNARSATASAYVEIADSVALVVSITPLDPSTVDPSQKVTLQAVLSQSDLPSNEITWNWSLESGTLQDPANAYNTPLTSQTLVINAGVLSQNTAYTFKVVATHALSGTSGSATITFNVASGPSSGGFSCPAANSPGESFAFDFGSLWTSTSGIVGYSIAFLPNDGSIEVPLVDSSLNTKISTLLPTGSIKVVGYVLSGAGIASRQECTMSLSYSDPSQGLQSLDNQASAQGLSVYDIARIIYSAKSTYLQSTKDSSAASLLQSIRSNLLQQLQGQSGGSVNQITAAIGALIPLTDPNLGAIPPSDIQAAVSILEALVNSARGTISDSNTLGANVEILGNIVGQLNSQTPQNTNAARNVRSDSSNYWTLYAKVATLSADVASLFMGAVSNGENALTISRNNMAVAVYKNTGQAVDAQGFSVGSGNLPSVSLSPGFLSEDSANAQSVQFVYLSMGGSPYPIDAGLSLASNVVILDIKADNQDVPLVALQPSARLTVPMNTNDLDRMQCMWYNETAWASEGCETQSSNRNVVCLCESAAIMAVMQVNAGGAITKQASKGLSTVWIAVIAVGAGLTVVAVLVGVFVVKRRRARRAARAGLPTAAGGHTDNFAPNSPRNVDPEAVAAAVATAASLSPEGESYTRRDSDLTDDSWSSRHRDRTSSFTSSASSPASSYRSGRTRTASSSSEEEIMESEIKNIANELNKQLPRDTRALEDMVNKMDME